MSKSAPQASVLTANRLTDGIVVYLDFEGAWNADLTEAVVARSPDEVKALEDRGAWDAARNIVVEPYLVEVREERGRPAPVRYRERVRAAGPSVLPPSPHSGSDPDAPPIRDSGHPGPLPASGERGPREALTEAA